MVSRSRYWPVHPYKWISASFCPYSSTGWCRSRSREFAWIGPWWTPEHPQPEPSQPDRPQFHRAGVRSAGAHLPGEPDPGADTTGQYAQPGHARPARDEVTKPGWVGLIRWLEESSWNIFFFCGVGRCMKSGHVILVSTGPTSWCIDFQFIV